MIDPNKLALNTGEVAELFGISRRHVCQWIADGYTPATKRGGRWSIPRSWVVERLQAFIDYLGKSASN